MAEIDLVSSHTPWTPLPRMVPWDQVGDGSVFDPQPASGRPRRRGLARRRRRCAQAYGQSIAVLADGPDLLGHQLHDPNLVLVVLGDHQPAAPVSGAGANHQVPVSMIAPDPSVLGRIASWHWQDGLLPSPPLRSWPMDAFRDRFFDAFGGAPADAPADSPAGSPAEVPAAAPR